VDIERIDNAPSTPSSRIETAGVTRIVAIGRLIPIKNMATLIRALSHVPSSRLELRIIGGGGLLTDLEQEVKDLGLAGSVVFLGRVDRETVYAELRDTDLFASASFGEGLPIAVLEAMACERPLLLSDIEPHREIVRTGSFARLIPAGDVDAWSESILQFAEMTQDERARAGRRGRAELEERFSLSRMLDGYDEIYRNCVAV